MSLEVPESCEGLVRSMKSWSRSGSGIRVQTNLPKGPVQGTAKEEEEAQTANERYHLKGCEVIKEYKIIGAENNRNHKTPNWRLQYA